MGMILGIVIGFLLFGKLYVGSDEKKYEKANIGILFKK